MFSDCSSFVRIGLLICSLITEVVLLGLDY